MGSLLDTTDAKNRWDAPVWGKKNGGLHERLYYLSNNGNVKVKSWLNNEVKS